MSAPNDFEVPLAVMTYTNPVGHMGFRRFAAALAGAGIAGAIVPDLPLDELEPWADAADGAGVETVLLAAPTTPDDRLRAICERSRGFVYGVALMGVTGERDQVASAAARDGGALQGGHRQAGVARPRHLHPGAGGGGEQLRRRRDRRERARVTPAEGRRPRRRARVRPRAPRRARRSARATS